MQVGNMAVFAYLLGDEEEGTGLVIDPAADVEAIIDEAKRNNLSIRYIVNTHGHVDHISGNAKMKKMTGAKIVIHEDDADMLVSTPLPVLRMFGAEPSPAADTRVKDGDTLSVGGITLTVIHTPGHSPGGISLYTPGYVFTGDTLFVEGVGRTDLPGGSWTVMLRSIEKSLFSLPDDTIVLPGHNYGMRATSTIALEKKNNPFL
jgi:glyoxylase-like metal-dependent hydrolase (beta-lactamase superfamily II)